MPPHPTRAGDALFLLSFRQRGELSTIAARAGWHVVAARRGDGAARRYAVSGALLAVLDARGALADGLAAAPAFGEAVRARGGALLVLVSQGDVDALGQFYEAGATHFLASSFIEGEFVQALRFAARRTAAVEGRDARRSDDLLAWRYHAQDKRVQLSPALARRHDVAEEIGVVQALRLLPAEMRSGIKAALERVADGGATAIAHDQDAAIRLVHHIQKKTGEPWVHSLVEELGAIPDVAAEMQEAMAPARDVDTVRRWVAHRLDHGEPVAAIIIALSRFDLVNATYGRTAGDALIRIARNRIEGAARKVLGRGRAMIARTKGPEFLVAIADIEPAERLAGILAETLVRPFAIDRVLVSVGVRVGVATARGGETVETLLDEAAEALDDARASDSVTVRVAGETRQIDVLAADLRRAIDDGEIGVLFQPQVAIGGGRITGVEALARWEHHRLGVIGAEPLLAAAERADLGLALSDHIQELALTGASRWDEVLSDLRLSINLTAADIARPGFADILLDRIDVSGFPRSRLTVEITESGLINDLGIAASLLTDLRHAGCRVAIDDFGTGYSSLAYLKALPLDYLKVDRKLAQDITGSARDRVVVRGVIEMARSLGLAVIAEGVENEEQLDLLAKEGCQYYQGFLCAEPVTGAVLAELVASRKFTMRKTG